VSLPADDLRALVADDLEVIAEASDGAEAVAAAAEVIALAPDVILMDVRMPGIDGIEATRRILEAMPTTRVLMLSVLDEPDDLLEAIKAGAAGYLLKETSINDIAESARCVARGHSFVSPALAGGLLAEFSRLARRADVGEEDAVRAPLLMPREVAVLEAMAEGATDGRIAEQLGLSAASTRNHVGNILEKQQLESLTAAVLYAVRSRLIDH